MGYPGAALKSQTGIEAPCREKMNNLKNEDVEIKPKNRQHVKQYVLRGVEREERGHQGEVQHSEEVWTDLDVCR